jgi:KDO2-lipid IV(A) lauroyltransferase
MKKERSVVADFAVYFLIRVLICTIQALSWRLALQLARALAWLTYYLDRRHRLVALDNVRQAFRHLDACDVERLTYASYVHLVIIIVEMCRLPRVLHAYNLNDYVVHAEPHDLERLRALAASGRPRLVVTGHFGNWELLSYISGLMGFPGALVARRLDNPYLDHFLARFRCRTGMTILDKNADYARILEILAKGGGLGMVGDQDAGARGLFVNFFGRPASTFKSIALLALEYGAPIMVMGAARVGHPMKYCVYYEDLILPEDYASRPDAARAITQRYSDALERMIRRHPEQYFWQHRRWKHEPRSKQVRKAA